MTVPVEQSGKVKVYVRVKPTEQVHQGYSFPSNRRLVVPHHNDAATEALSFGFDRVFGADTSQAEVFHVVGRDAVANTLGGLNSTIFAFGMTGSGKTHTMLGPPHSFDARGLVPRCLSFLYQQINAASTGMSYKVALTYVQIYQEHAYDLFMPPNYYSNEASMPKVGLSDDGAGGVCLRNCSEKVVANEEEAMSLLVWASNNRVVAETACNIESSRSHCVLTLNLTATHADGETMNVSKLNLVDLAGSERVAKTGAEGLLLKEACDINLSLHFLEQVISALHRGDEHVPYRNSVMTNLLRDSLGGNCCTSMIATITPESAHVHETLQTCRFAQRVSAVKNSARINICVDPKVAMQRMKKEMAAMRAELEWYRAQEGNEGGAPADVSMELTPDEREFCQAKVSAFLSNEQNHLPLSNPREVRGFFHELREQLLSAAIESTGQGRVCEPEAAVSHPAQDSANLTRQLEERDAQLAYLQGMLESKGCAKRHPLRTSVRDKKKEEHGAPRHARRRGIRSSEQAHTQRNHPLHPPRAYSSAHGGAPRYPRSDPAPFGRNPRNDRFRNRQLVHQEEAQPASHPAQELGGSWLCDEDISKAWQQSKSKKLETASAQNPTAASILREASILLNDAQDEDCAEGKETGSSAGGVSKSSKDVDRTTSMLPYIGRDPPSLIHRDSELTAVRATAIRHFC